jgi:hypothetical protein
MRTTWMILALPLALVGCDKGSGDDTDPASEDSGVDGAGDDGTGDDGTGDDAGAADDTGGVWGQEALDLVTARAGTYQGAWEMLGLDAGDEPYTYLSWTDDIVGSNPRIEGDRAMMDVTDFMVLEDYGDYEISWIEGVLIEEDGSPGEEFMEMDGEVTIFSQVKDGYYEYQTELARSDFSAWANVTQDNLISGYHTTYKVVTWPDGMETHDITRVTTLEWDAGDGPQTIEFTSMTGRHQKVK